MVSLSFSNLIYQDGIIIDNKNNQKVSHEELINMLDNDENLNSFLLANFLNKYAETGNEYVKIIKKIIQQNSLTDFDDVKILPTSLKLKKLI